MSDNNNSRIRVGIHEEDPDENYDENIYHMGRLVFAANPYTFSDQVFYPDLGMTPIEEIRRALDHVSALDVMAGFFNEFMNEEGDYGMSEEEMIQIAQTESLNHYKTQEKKPNVKLDLEGKIATDKSKGDNCTICVSDIEEGDKITELECNHVLHTECISEWVKYKSECPVCRHDIKTTDTTECKNSVDTP